jgi:restriction system protein
MDRPWPRGPDSPHELDPLFTGRQDELARLHNWAAGRPGFGAVIVGIGGIGKSSLARRFAREHVGERVAFVSIYDMGEAAWWALRDDFGRAAVEVEERFPGQNDPLLVVDGAERTHPRAVARAVQEFRTTHGHSGIVLTTRDGSLVSELRGGLVEPWLAVSLGRLSEAETRAFLNARLGVLQVDDAAALVEIGQGHPLMLRLLAGLVAQGARPQELVKRFAAQEWPGIIDSQGRAFPLDQRPSSNLVLRIQAFSDDLIAVLAERPELMRELSPRRFEELVAELYQRQGFEIELTPETRDGGVDLYVVRHESFGRVVTAVECKRWTSAVGVEIVRQLYGVVEHEDLNAGVLVTTSRFTRDAQEFRAKHRLRLALQDYFDLQTLLRDTTHRKLGGS